MNADVLKLGLENLETQELLEELDKLELELINSEETDKNFGFVFSKGGGSRPRPSITY